MTRKTPTRRAAARSRTARTPVTSRSVLLAGLGAVSLGRRQAKESIDGFAANADTFQQRSTDLAHSAGRKVAALASKAQARLAPLKKQASSFASKAEAQFLVSVAPMLEKLGVIDAPARRHAPARPRKSAAGAKPATRRAKG